MTDIEIAKNVKLENIENIAKKAGIEPEDIECYGKYKAKISDKIFEKVKKQENGKLVLVTAISPTPLGEGKTTISIAIADGLQKIGKKSMLCLREPSLGPVFGIKGGATGGGHSQVAPMEDINLHFTGDIHAITSANNLLSAMIDNHIYFGNELKFKKVVWKRCVDLNDRQLRTVNTGLSGESKIVQREDHFDITVASEIMAIVCLSKDIFEHTGITDAVENNQGHNWLVMLNVQYRMHQDIANFVSKEMYGDRLKTHNKIIESRNEIAACRPCANSAMAMVDLSKMYSVCTKIKDNSRINILSALFSIRIAEINITMYEVGIITPYNAQSRLILAMLRDIQEYDSRWEKVICSTVHQFQGSEKSIILYDAVDCFRMPYLGTLLTSLQNDTANRLFNVAFTRAKGKFILIANRDYLKRKHISKKLIFTKAINKIANEGNFIKGLLVLDELMPSENEKTIVYVEDRERSWKTYIEDIKVAKKSIHMDIPDVIEENDEALEELCNVLNEKKEQGLNICIRLSEDINLPDKLEKYRRNYEYVTNPITLIDKKKIWFGQPLYAADFISEGEILGTECFPCIRFIGKHTTRLIQAFLEI